MSLMVDVSKLKRAVLAAEQTWEAVLEADKLWQALQAEQFNGPADVSNVLAVEKQAIIVHNAKALHSFASATVVAKLRKAIDAAEARNISHKGSLQKITHSKSFTLLKINASVPQEKM
ncbi:hypothetical protein [Pseudomonas canadensis]|uniref:hypothetical protein n=1 Tax=Pseudomonas canadensis TaxID=915099 RepID=UPI003B9FFA8C